MAALELAVIGSYGGMISASLNISRKEVGFFGTMLGWRKLSSPQNIRLGGRAAHGGKYVKMTSAKMEQVATMAGDGGVSGFASLSAGTSSSPPPSSSSQGPSIPPAAGVALLAAAGLAYFAKRGSSVSTSPSTSSSTSPPSKLPPPNTSLPPRTVTEAAPAAMRTIAHYFPNSMQDEAFVDAVANELFKLGFSKDNCIALVNTCRDEVCRPLAGYIDQQFGLSFNISGLGGLINCGKTGLKAGMSHSPEFPCDVDGKPRERYVFFAFPHVSVGETGEVGSLLRRGRGKPSSACGALIAIKNDSNAGTLSQEDAYDAEYITLKKKVLAQPACRNCGPEGPSLVTVTKAALQAITDDIESLIKKTVNPETSDFAVITGIQIHSGNQIPGKAFRVDRTIDYISPGAMYAVIRGKRYEMQVTQGGRMVEMIQPISVL